jgi:subtilisin family serine protease
MAAPAAEKSAAARVLGDLTGAGTGVEKSWLNARAKATPDGSVPGIGAPAAWSTGLTGTVAVLDTGVDTDHADLAGRGVRRRDAVARR